VTDHRLVPVIRHRLTHVASPDVIASVVDLINEDPLALDECGFKFGDGCCVRVRGHEASYGDETHVNAFGQTKFRKQPIKTPALF
jgi:hypothetical protein